jgi:histidinol-phosphate aminotransferase
MSPRVSPPVADRVPVRDDLADLEPYGAPQLDAAVRLNTNETPYPVPPGFGEALAKRVAASELNRYPDRTAWALRAALGERFGRGPQQVWPANGSNEVCAQLLTAYGGPGRSVLLFRPGYAGHPLIARVTGTGVVEADLDADLSLDAGLVETAIACHDPDLVCIASPNNPTGIPAPVEALRAAHDAARGLLIVDEAYAEFADPQASVAPLVGELERLVVTRTFSKAWRLAGIRLGYALAPEWVVDDLAKVRLPYHLDALTQEAGVLALSDPAEVTAHIPAVVAERERLAARLAATEGVEVFPSSANFLLVRTGCYDLFERLLARGVLVRDVADQPRLQRCVRVTVGTAEENDAFLSALEDSLVEQSASGRV